MENRGKNSSTTLSDLRLGFVHFLPVGLVITGYALVFGALAAGAGLSVPEACFMSLTIFAGASQFIALPMIQDGASTGTLAGMALLVNLRHLLYGLNVGRKFAGAATWKLLGLSFGIVDETYAFAVIGPGRRIRSIPYFLGTALCPYVTWNAGTLAGASAARLAAIPGTGSLDFAMVAVFVAMVGTAVRERVHWLSVGLSAVVALLVRSLAGGYWHLFAAGLLVPFVLAGRGMGEDDMGGDDAD